MTAKDRFANRSSLGAAVWSQRLAAPVTERLEALLRTCPRPGTAPEIDALHLALTPFMEPDQTMRASAELLIVGRYDHAVGQAIEATVGPILREALTPRGSALTRAQAARHAYVCVVALGLMVHSRRSPMPAADLVSETASIAQALASDVKPTALPRERLAVAQHGIDFDTGDPAWEALLQATIDQVGSLGYEAATVEVITAAAGCTRGLLFARYDSKSELFTDAADRVLAEGVTTTAEYQSQLTHRYGEGVAEAAMMREFALPKHRNARTVHLEQVRLCWHDEPMLAKIATSYAEAAWRLAETQPDKTHTQLSAYLHVGLALGIGVNLLPELYPDVWRLPMDVVTVPKLGAVAPEQPRRSENR